MPTRNKLKNNSQRKRRAPSSEELSSPINPVVVIRRGSPASALSADKPYTLLELAEHLHPRTLYCWRKTIEWLANNHRWPTWS